MANRETHFFTPVDFFTHSPFLPGAMNLAFNFGALLVATGLARTGLPPTSIPNVTASINDIIVRIPTLSTTTPHS